MSIKMSKDTAYMVKVLEEFSRLDRYSDSFTYSIGMARFDNGKYLDWHISKLIRDGEDDLYSDASVVIVASSYFEHKIPDDEKDEGFAEIREAIDSVINEYALRVCEADDE
mgnify:CR=1 FL=1